MKISKKLEELAKKGVKSIKIDLGHGKNKINQEECSMENEHSMVNQIKNLKKKEK